MPTLTPNYGWNLPLVNDPTDEDQWGGLLNQNISSQDTIIKEIQDDANLALAPVDGGELTIASGVITVTGYYHTIDTEGDAAIDDLVTINGGTDGRPLILRIENSARDVVIKSTGNIGVDADITLSSSNDLIFLKYDEDKDKWLPVSATASQGAKADTALQQLFLDTETATGSAFSFLTIPSTVNSIEICVSGLMSSDINQIVFQLGSTEAEITGYTGSGSLLRDSANPVGQQPTDKFLLYKVLAAQEMNGNITLRRLSGTNTWIADGQMSVTGGASNNGTAFISGKKTVTTEAIQLYFSTTGTFDAGTIQVKGF